MEGWYISDISMAHFAQPTLDERDMLSITNYEIPNIETYYWLAPSVYSGNKLLMYGSNLTFKVHWEVMRGDTSGKPTRTPNVILVGENGMRIGTGADLFESSNMTFEVQLMEEGWYQIPSDLDVQDLESLLYQNFETLTVGRRQFMSILVNVKRILLRAKFHEDQIQVSLEQAVMESNLNQSNVEKCSCPSGYTGLSCETCDYGYVRIMFGNESDDNQQQQQQVCKLYLHS